MCWFARKSGVFVCGDEALIKIASARKLEFLQYAAESDVRVNKTRLEIRARCFFRRGLGAAQVANLSSPTHVIQINASPVAFHHQDAAFA